MHSEDILPQGLSRETSIRRDSQGVWYFEGEPIEHKGITAAFDRWIDRAPDGRYCLKNSIHWVYCALEGPAFFVQTLRVEADQVVLGLRGGETERLDPHTLREDKTGRLYCDVRAGAFSAVFVPHAMMQLWEHAEEDADGAYLLLGHKRFTPVVVADPLAENWTSLR